MAMIKDVSEVETVDSLPWSRWALIALVCLHFILACLYATRTPYRQAGVLKYQGRAPAADIGAPDERQHANYVFHLVEGKGIPVFDPSDPNLYETYQSHQPPLYYGVAMVAAKLGGMKTPEDARGLRFLNCLIGSAGVLGVYFAALWGFRRNSWAVASAAFAGLLPMNVALSGAISNDPLLFALLSWGLAVLFLCLRDSWTLKRSVLLGLIAGCAVLTKTTGVALVPAILVGAFWSKSSRPCWGSAAATVAIFACLALPWWMRNTELYGDPLAIKAFGEAFKGSAQAATFIQAFGAPAYWTDWVGWWTARSLLGAFGYMDIFLSDGLYRVWIGVLLLMFGLGSVALKRSRPADSAPALAATSVLLAVVLVLFLRFNSQYFQGQARYLLPAIAPLSLFATAAVLALKPTSQRVSLGALSAILLALNLYVLSILPAEFAARMPPS